MRGPSGQQAKHRYASMQLRKKETITTSMCVTKNVHHGILASYDEMCETMHFLSGILYDSTNMLYMPDNCQQAEKCGPILSSILQKLKALCKC